MPARSWSRASKMPYRLLYNLLIHLGLPLAQYQNFLLLIGSVFAPLFGVVLVDHFILRQRSARVAPELWRWPLRFRKGRTDRNSHRSSRRA